jgi:hypothetical protein
MKTVWRQFMNSRVFPLVTAVFLGITSTASAQWLKHPTPGVPRTADGKPNLSAPAPRTADGKPDLSGLWHAGPNAASDFKPADALPWGREVARRREINPASDGWSTLCLPPGPLISFTGPMRIVQTPQLVAMLYEFSNNFRQIYTDGRALPKDPNPTFQGYSIGRWDGDTFVVETIGYNDRSLVGRPAYPHTESLRTIERYRRRDFGHMDLEMTVDDPKAFTRPWTMSVELLFDADTDLIEYVCNENEKSRQHFVQPSDTSEFRVDPAVLAKYAGMYEVMTPRGMAKATIRVEDDQLMIDVPAFGSGRMIPQSATMFQFRGAVIEFVPNEHGEVTHLIAHAVEGDFKGPRIK